MDLHRRSWSESISLDVIIWYYLSYSRNSEYSQISIKYQSNINQTLQLWPSYFPNGFQSMTVEPPILGLSSSRSNPLDHLSDLGFLYFLSFQNNQYPLNWYPSSAIESYADCWWLDLLLGGLPLLHGLLPFIFWSLVHWAYIFSWSAWLMTHQHQQNETKNLNLHNLYQIYFHWQSLWRCLLVISGQSGSRNWYWTEFFPRNFYWSSSRNCWSSLSFYSSLGRMYTVIAICFPFLGLAISSWNSFYYGC